MTFGNFKPCKIWWGIVEKKTRFLLFFLHRIRDCDLYVAFETSLSFNHLVPLPNSSKSTSEFAVAFFRISFVSFNSTKNVLWPAKLNILSFLSKWFPYHTWSCRWHQFSWRFCRQARDASIGRGRASPVTNSSKLQLLEFCLPYVQARRVLRPVS